MRNWESVWMISLVLPAATACLGGKVDDQTVSYCRHCFLPDCHDACLNLGHVVGLPVMKVE